MVALHVVAKDSIDVMGGNAGIVAGSLDGLAGELELATAGVPGELRLPYAAMAALSLIPLKSARLILLRLPGSIPMAYVFRLCAWAVTYPAAKWNGRFLRTQDIIDHNQVDRSRCCDLQQVELSWYPKRRGKGSGRRAAYVAPPSENRIPLKHSNANASQGRALISSDMATTPTHPRARYSPTRVQRGAAGAANMMIMPTTASPLTTDSTVIPQALLIDLRANGV